MRIGCRFEILKKAHRSDVCDVEIRHGFEDWTSIMGWMSILILIYWGVIYREEFTIHLNTIRLFLCTPTSAISF